MEIGNQKAGFGYTQAEVQKSEGKKSLSNDRVQELRIEIKSFQISVAKQSLENFGIQQPKSFEAAYAGFRQVLEDIGYDGLPIADLNEEEAASLVAEEGIFGIKQTSERLSQFVINGGGEDIDMLRAGREGIIAGYQQAETMWGGELPEISKKTLEKALEMIDTRMAEMGFSAINFKG